MHQIIRHVNIIPAIITLWDRFSSPNYVSVNIMYKYQKREKEKNIRWNHLWYKKNEKMDNMWTWRLRLLDLFTLSEMGNILCLLFFPSASMSRPPICLWTSSIISLLGLHPLTAGHISCGSCMHISSLYHAYLAWFYMDKTMFAHDMMVNRRIH